MMKLVRLNPTMTRTPRTFNRMPLYRTAPYANPAPAVLRPALDIVDEDTQVTLLVNLPGVNPEDVEITVDDGVMTISGEFASVEEQEGERYHYRERRTGAFKRAVRLNEHIDTDNAAANFENGVLTVVLPKLPEVQPKRIKVEMA